ncbi:hypothetical protein GCM10010276_27550 [Streptomyces longisporus]|uniref:Uncharacterized protein n=1 Tax=Streptomyces longisporus TaxID=1948 RepID=A0ABN3LSU9_STRLO
MVSPFGVDRRSTKSSPRVRAGGGEEARALADDHRTGERHDRVDQPVVEPIAPATSPDRTVVPCPCGSGDAECLRARSVHEGCAKTASRQGKGQLPQGVRLFAPSGMGRGPVPPCRKAAPRATVTGMVRPQRGKCYSISGIYGTSERRAASGSRPEAHPPTLPA